MMFNNTWFGHIQKMNQWINIYRSKLDEAQIAFDAMDHTYTPIFDEYPIVINTIIQGQKQSRLFTVKDVKNALAATKKRLKILQKMYRSEQISQEEYEFLKLSQPFNKDTLVLNYPEKLIKEDPARHQYASCQI